MNHKTRLLIPALVAVTVIILSQPAEASAAKPKAVWKSRIDAVHQYMMDSLWNPSTRNFIRRSDVAPLAQGSDAWGITIVIEAYSSMVEQGLIKPEVLRHYFETSTALYERTDNGNGARILARRGSDTYIGVDDDFQWIAALMHAYQATKEDIYLTHARSTFNAMIALGFWNTKTKGWSWNSSDLRPNGVSTAYGALAAARLFAATKNQVYKQWVAASLNAIEGEMVGYFPRDMMVAAEAATIAYQVSKQPEFLVFAERTAKIAKVQVEEVIKGTRSGERNPTDVGELAEGFYVLAEQTGNAEFRAEAERVTEFFFQKTTPESLKAGAGFSRYDASGKPVLEGSYLGVPLKAHYLPEVAELLKLAVLGYRFAK